MKNYPSAQMLSLDAGKTQIIYDLCYIGVISSNRGIVAILNILHLIKVKYALAGMFDNTIFEEEIKKAIQIGNWLVGSWGTKS